MNQKIPHKNMSHKRVRHKKITDRHNGKEQIYYEIRKVLSGTRSRLAFLLLAMILGITLYFALSVEYVNEAGESERGPAAVASLRAAQKAWSGYLEEETIRQVIAENRRINETPEGRSEQIIERNIAYSWKHGIAEIRRLLNCSYAEAFRSYDYYRADSLTEEAAGEYYPPWEPPVSRFRATRKFLP